MDGCLHRPAPWLLSVLSTWFLSTIPSATPSFALSPTHFSSVFPFLLILSNLGPSTWGQASMVRHKLITWNHFPLCSTSNESSAISLLCLVPMSSAHCRAGSCEELTKRIYSLFSFLLPKYSLYQNLQEVVPIYQLPHFPEFQAYTQNEPPSFIFTDPWLRKSIPAMLFYDPANGNIRGGRARGQ